MLVDAKGLYALVEAQANNTIK
jgi:hypothetical protein